MDMAFWSFNHVDLLAVNNLKNTNRLWKTIFTFLVVATANHLILNRSQAVAFSFSQLSSKTGLEHESSDLIRSTVYSRPSSTYSRMAADGSNSVNRDYAQGLSSNWFIEEQRFGADAIISGLIHNNSQAIDAGFKMFDWGLSQQQNDGSFLPTQDPFHSTSMFLGSAAYGLLSLQESTLADQYNSIIDTYLPKLQLAGQWMIQEDNWTRGINNNSPYSHRDYTVAKALGLTGKLTGDQELIAYANQSISQGLSKQLINGVNPEKGGHDSSYQMAGALDAMRWLTHFSTDTLASSVAEMVNAALTWEESMILSSGEISTEGNTRTDGTETTRSGQVKRVNQRDVIHGFSFWSSMTGDERWGNHAVDVARYYYAHDAKIMNSLAVISPIDVDHPVDEPVSVPEASPLTAIVLMGLGGCVVFFKKRIGPLVSG